eukprot:3566295-Pleurochrysis_carterae.AAC.3
MVIISSNKPSSFTDQILPSFALASQVEFNLSTGYPLHLPRRVEYNAEQRHSAVSYIGRGGAHLPSGLYAAHFDGNGSLSFGDDAREIGYDYDDAAQRGRYLLNITASTGSSYSSWSHPFAAQDQSVRKSSHQEIRMLFSRQKATIKLISHEQAES